MWVGLLQNIDNDLGILKVSSITSEIFRLVLFFYENSTRTIFQLWYLVFLTFYTCLYYKIRIFAKPENTIQAKHHHVCDTFTELIFLFTFTIVVQLDRHIVHVIPVYWTVFIMP